MKALELHQMEKIEGGNECALAGAGMLLTGIGIGVAAATGPFGWAMGAYLTTQAGVSLASLYSACGELG